jgi:hypothetical protein
MEEEVSRDVRAFSKLMEKEPIELGQNSVMLL